MDGTTWNDVVGQELLTDNLQNVLQYNKISHAYLIQGEKLSGKRMIAELFARALQCECGRQHIQQQTSLFDLGLELDVDNQEDETSVQIKPCNQCRSCKQAIHGNHPDIIYIEHEKPNIISVNEIRYQVNEDIAIKPYSGIYKVYIIDEAEKMNVQAQNALLKTLEEPPEYAVILLLVTNIEAMLPTIVSRCVTLHTRLVSENKIKEYLMKKVQIPDYRASVCASFSRGNVGRAMELAANEKFDRMKSTVLGVLKGISDMEINQMAAQAKQIAEEKLDTDDYLDLCFLWYRDVLLYKASSQYDGKKNLLFQEEEPEIASAAKYYSYEGLERIIHSIEQARNRIRSNVNLGLTMELLLMDMKAQ